MANKFEPIVPPETAKALVTIRLLPDTLRRLDGHAKAYNLHRNVLASQMIEYMVAQLGEPKANGRE